MSTNISEELARLAALRDQGHLSDAEFAQQKAALLGGVTPQPAKKPGKGKMAIGCVVLVVAILAILAAIGSTGSGNSAGSTESVAADPTTPAETPVEVTAVELFKAYEANEAGAQQRFGGRALLVTGTIDGVELDLSDDPVINLKTTNQFMSAKANLVEADHAKAGGLNKGQSVRLLCASVSEIVSIPVLADCRIQ